MASKFKQTLSGQLITEGNNILGQLYTIQDLDQLSLVFKKFFNWRETTKDYVNFKANISDQQRASFFTPSKVLSLSHGMGETINSKEATLIKKLIEEEIKERINFLSQTKEKVDLKYNDYNPKTLEISIGGNTFKIGQKTTSNHALLMKHLSKRRTKEVDTYDLLKDAYGINPNIEKIIFDKAKKDKKTYHAGKKINEFVFDEIGISDFLIVSTKSIQINPKYL